MNPDSVAKLDQVAAGLRDCATALASMIIELTVVGVPPTEAGDLALRLLQTLMWQTDDTADAT